MKLRKKTWEVPKNAKITWLDEDSIDGEKCPTYDPENLGEDYLDTPWRKPSVQAARHSHSRKISLSGEASLFTPILEIDDVGSGVQLYFFFLTFNRHYLLDFVYHCCAINSYKHLREQNTAIECGLLMDAKNDCNKCR